MNSIQSWHQIRNIAPCGYTIYTSWLCMVQYTALWNHHIHYSVSILYLH